MANPTTNYGFVLPTSTDLVTDLPADFDVALQGVDTRLKALQPGTTLGDVAYSSATANTNTRLGIGTSGQVLTVSGGVPAWTTLPASSPNSATNRVNTQQTTTSLTYTALGTAQSVTLTTGTKVMVIVSSGNTSGTVGFGAYASYAVSGATTIAVSDVWATGMDEIARSTATDQQSYVSYQTVTAGSNTFTLQFRAVGGGTAYFKNRQLTVVDLGS